MARTTPTVEMFSRTVEAIYDAALNPGHWQTALQRIGELIDSPCVCLSVTDYGQQEVALCVNHGYEPEYLKVYFEKFAINPLFSLGHLRPVGDVYTLAMLLESKDLVESRFYKEWSKPQGLGDFMGLNAVRSARRAGGISGNRMLAQARYSDDDVHLLGLLAPHVCRSFAVTDALDLKSVASDALEATLDALASGVYLIDNEGRVTYANRAAEQQLKASTVLRIVNKRLSAVTSDAQDGIRRAIADAIADEAAAPIHGTSIALTDGMGAGLVATILPLNRGNRYSPSAAHGAAAAVFVQDPAVAPPYPGEAFAKLYGLTGAELRVLLAIAPGIGVREVATTLGIGEVTARIHLQHIYSKTGTSKVTELINLLRNVTPPVKAS
jgi:DNA-binding CsgD family transcriptional regulator/PAS domain-containing protein